MDELILRFYGKSANPEMNTRSQTLQKEEVTLLGVLFLFVIGACLSAAECVFTSSVPLKSRERDFKTSYCRRARRSRIPCLSLLLS